MPSSLSPATIAPDYMADVDPTGAIASAAREVGELIEKDMGSVGAVFFATYMRETGLQDRLGRTIINRIEQEADRYVREKLLHFAEGRLSLIHI